VSGSNLEESEFFMGIDQSYSGFGLIVLQKEYEYDRQLWKFPVLGSDGARLHRIREEISSYLSPYKGKSVRLAIEGYAHASRFNREKLGELGGIVKLAWFEFSGEGPLVVPPTVLKKFTTGKGNASKDQMRIGAKEKWGVDIANDNLVDAYALAKYCMESMINSS
jgi:Holliday junction resolvasome RuvABC endonuclease subunit